MANQITRKEYEAAKQTCDYYFSKDKSSPLYKTIMDLRKRITYSEMSDLILNGIVKDTTPDEEKAFIDFIEKALRTSAIKKEAIILGKRKEGSRSITLADIWEEQNERQY